MLLMVQYSTHGSQPRCILSHGSSYNVLYCKTGEAWLGVEWWIQYLCGWLWLWYGTVSVVVWAVVVGLQMWCKGVQYVYMCVYGMLRVAHARAVGA